MTLLHRRDPDRRMARFYRLALQWRLGLPELAERANHLTQDGQTDRPLASRRNTALRYCASSPVGADDGCDLIREWGRIGSPGQVRADPHPDAEMAERAAATLEALKRRKGYR